MEQDSIMAVLAQNFSDYTIRKLTHILKFKSLDDIVYDHFQVCELNNNTFSAMLRFKIVNGLLFL